VEIPKFAFTTNLQADDQVDMDQEEGEEEENDFDWNKALHNGINKAKGIINRFK
jgi:hypothetical protein